MQILFLFILFTLQNHVTVCSLPCDACRRGGPPFVLNTSAFSRAFPPGHNAVRSPTPQSATQARCSARRNKGIPKNRAQSQATHLRRVPGPNPNVSLLLARVHSSTFYRLPTHIFSLVLSTTELQCHLLEVSRVCISFSPFVILFCLSHFILSWWPTTGLD